MNDLKNLLSSLKAENSNEVLLEKLKDIGKVLGQDEFKKATGRNPKNLNPKTRPVDLRMMVRKLDSVFGAEAELVGEAIKTTLKLANPAVSEDLTMGNAADAGFAAELGSIDFATIIGGPLDACVKAQANAAISTVSFIKEVGFDENKKLIMVDFSYNKKGDSSEGDEVEIKVPFLAILNIPSFRIESCEINFNVKLNSTYTKDVKSEVGMSTGVKGGWGPVKFSVDVSAKRSSSTGIKVEKEYSLGVIVKATGDEMPAGLEKVLGLLSQ